MLALHVRNEANSLLMSYNTLLTSKFFCECGLELPTSWSVDWLATITPTRPADLDCELMLDIHTPNYMNNLMKYFSLIQFCITLDQSAQASSPSACSH